MIKAIFADFDGTIFSHKTKKIPESAIEAFKEVHKNGIKIFLATGRSRPELEWFDMSNISFDGYVLGNGQLLCDKDLKIIKKYPLTGKIKDIILDKFINNKLPIAITDENNFFINYVDDKVRYVQAQVSSKIPPIKEYENEDILMASAYLINDSIKDEMLSLCNLACITYWQDGAIDIVAYGSSKVNGIAEMLKIENLSKDEIIAIGDGFNDVEMIKYAGIGIAMGNSEDDTKKIADYITDDIDNDGFYNALKHFNLI